MVKGLNISFESIGDEDITGPMCNFTLLKVGGVFAVYHVSFIGSGHGVLAVPVGLVLI